MIASNHDGTDARLTAFHNSVFYLRADGIDHAAQAGEAELLLQILRLTAFRLGAPAALRAGQDAQGPVGHVFIGGKNFLSVSVGHGNRAAIFQVEGAFLDDHIRRALGVLDISAVRSVYGGHHFPAGIEGGFAAAGKPCLQLRLCAACFCGPGNQRRFRGLSGHGSVRILLRVAAERHGGRNACFILSEEVYHGHFVLGQGSCLVGADDLSAAQGFHSGQPADDGIAFRHVGHADGKNHGDYGGKAFRDGRYGEGNGDHEGVKGEGEVKASGPDDLDGENHHADGQHDPGQDAGKLAEFSLQGRLALLRLFQRVGNFSHFRLHSGGSDHSASTTINHGASHVDHIFPVAKRDVLLAV